MQNVGAEPQTIRLSLRLPRAVQLVSSVPDARRLAPGETTTVLLKGLVSQAVAAGAEPIDLTVYDDGGGQRSFRFWVQVVGRRQAAVTLSQPEETLVLLAAGEPGRLPIRLVHNRPTSARYTIDIASMPEGLNRAGMPLPVLLRSGQDTSLYIPLRPLVRWSVDLPYELVVTLRDGQGQITGSLMYRLVVATDQKRYVAGYDDRQPGYGVATALARNNTQQWARELRVWGIDSIGRAQLDFQLNYLNYGSDHIQQLQNSYVGLTARRLAARLGTLYDYHELPLFGRGLRVALGDAREQLTLWAVNPNPNWLQTAGDAWTGNVFSARYDRQLDRLPGASYALSSSFFTQQITHRAGWLHYGSFRYDAGEHHRVQLLLGQSSEFARQRPDRAATHGWAGQLHYTYQQERFSAQVRAYKSSPAYSGIQRGATLLYGQLFWAPTPRTNLLARLNYIDYDRLVFSSPVDARRVGYGNVVAEAGVTQRVGSLMLGLRPYYFAQHDRNSPGSQRTESYRLVPNVAVYRGAGQHIDFSYDLGLLYNRSEPGASGYRSERFTVMAQVGAFSLLGYLQRGPYYLFDLQNRNPADLRLLSITPTYAMQWRQLRGSVGLSYSHSETTNESRYTAVGQVFYDVTPTLTLNLTGSGSPYAERPEYAFSQYRLEVSKTFRKSRGRRNGQLDLTFYQDLNGNGRRETGEPWMDSLLVRVNGNTLFTNSRGRISYRHLPPGLYHVSTLWASRVGDPVLFDQTLPVSGPVSREVPLARTFGLRGRLRCQQPAGSYASEPCRYDRFLVEVYGHTDQQRLASIGPQADGQFLFHLPAGRYTVQVQDCSRLPRVLVKSITVDLGGQESSSPLELPVEGVGRPVEVRRFTRR
ncbi:hypothetical protein GCM10027578_26780 [Spirosoma luteolum]